MNPYSYGEKLQQEQSQMQMQQLAMARNANGPERPIGPLTSATGEVELIASQLHQAFSILEERLFPILQLQPPAATQAGTQGQMPPPSQQLSQRIEMSVRSLKQLGERLAGLVERLEL